MQHAGLAGTQGGRMVSGLDTLTCCLDAIDRDRFVVEERMEEPDGIRAAADTGDQRIRQAACHIEHLLARFTADYGLEVTHHGRVWMRAGDGADDIESVVDVRDPVAHRFVECILECPGTRANGNDFRTKQLHAVDIGLLACDIDLTHVDDALEPEARGDSGRGYAMLACTCLCNDARLAHALGKQGLANGVVDLVCAGMIEVLSLEKDLRAAKFTAPAFCMVDRGWTPDIVLQVRIQFCLEFGILHVFLVGKTQFMQRLHESFGNENAAIGAKVAILVRHVLPVSCCLGRHAGLLVQTLRLLRHP